MKTRGYFQSRLIFTTETWTEVGNFSAGWLVVRLVQLDVEDCSEELLRQQSYVIKKLVGGFGCDELVLYGIRLLAQATL